MRTREDIDDPVFVVYRNEYRLERERNGFLYLKRVWQTIAEGDLVTGFERSPLLQE